MRACSPKKIDVKIDRDDWSAAIQEALRPVPGISGGRTVAEIASETGRGACTVRKMLRKAMVEGILSSTPGFRVAIDGTYRTSPTYKLKEV